MRPLKLTALAVLLVTYVPTVLAQSSKPSESSSKVSATESVDVPADEAFAGFQHVTKDMKPPKAVKAPDPKYPNIQADDEPNGVVVMLIGIGTNGRVQLVHVLRSSNAAFEASAVTTVRTWKFSPAKKDGQPVPVQITVEMRFTK